MTDAMEAASWERWNEATSGIADGFETRPSGPTRDFRGRVRTYSVLGLDYFTIETNARSTRRGPDTLRRPDRHHCLVYQLRGRSMVRQGRRVAMLNPSEMALLSPAESCELVNHGHIRQISFLVPEKILFERVGSTDLPSALSIQSHSALGSLISTLMLQVHSRSRELADIFSPTLDVVMASLLAPLLKDERGDAGAAAHGHDFGPAVNVVSVSRFIDANLRNGNLSPRYIARALGCSVRHVHRLFDGSGTTVAAYIKRQRLLAVAEELQDPSRECDSITEISLRWGFPEITHFSRSFRAEFGMSPRDYRFLACSDRATVRASRGPA